MLVALDLVLAAWVAAWIWLGVAVGNQVSGLRRVAAPVETLGTVWLMYGEEPEFRQLLARRALGSFSYGPLGHMAGPEPWRAYDEGRYDALAEAELRRWGVGPRPPGAGTSRPRARRYQG